MAYNYGKDDKKKEKYASTRKEGESYGEPQKYSTDKGYEREEKPIPQRLPLRDEVEYMPEMVKKETRIVHQTPPRLEDEALERIRRKTPIVVGSLFDRVAMLEQRIAELRASINERLELNMKITSEIESDISEKESMISVVSDSNERRNLKMDISVLRKERRHEYVQSWRDILELKTELRELEEQHDMEKKISSVLGGDGND